MELQSKHEVNASHAKKTSGSLGERNQSFFRAFIQPKLTINQPNDVYEQEADAMADKVMRMPENGSASPSFFKPSITSVQRKCKECEEDERQQLQRKEINNTAATADSELDHFVSNLSGGGRPLDKEVRNFFEPRMGYDFSNVKVHTDSAAAKSAQSVNALAYTAGSDIVFNSGQFAPNTESGKGLLGHELTHVVQQGGASLKGETHNVQRKTSTQLIQRAVTDTKQETYAGLFELTRHNPTGGPTFTPKAQYDIRIEFTPYQVVDCDQIAMTQTFISRTGGAFSPPSPEARARQLTAAEGTEGVTLDRLTGKTSPLYGRDNAGTAAGTTHFGSRTGNSRGGKAWMTDRPGWPGTNAADSRAAGITDSSHFETCAICNAGKDQNVYYGCVNWGYDIDAANKFTEDSFALVSKGTPSANFLAAAKKWNDQTVLVATVPVATDDLPLPTHKTKQTSMTEAELKTEITTLETTLKGAAALIRLAARIGVAAGNVDIPQITFEIKVYKDILEAITYNKSQGYSQVDIKAIQAVVDRTPNGTFDFDTILKIKRWQVERSMKGDGRFGPGSKSKLDAMVSAGVTANKGKGFTPAQIKKIQVEVGSKDDGNWDPTTVKQLMAWQKDHSLVATGEFNVITQFFMFGIMGF